MTPLKVSHSAELYRDQLASQLYLDVAALLWEIVRNHCIGCMVDTKVWNPENVHVEIQLVTDWKPPEIAWTKLNGGRCLFIFDAGHGFRDEDFRRFAHVGPLKGEDRDRFGGGSQKNMGRFGGIPLNLSSKDDTRCGYMVYTRTAVVGPVTAMEATPVGFSEGLLPRREIDADSPELGPYRNYRGSFSLSVIPNCVFETHEQIADGLCWYMPCKRDRTIKVLVGGKKLVAPPLAKQVIVHGGIEAYLEKHTDKDRKGGIWLCDAESGLRCAYAPAMSMMLPWPLGKESLGGVIFGQGWYKNQNTSRSGFQSDYFRTKAWKAAFATMQLKVVPFATSLLDLDEETFGDSSGLDRAVQSVAGMFAQCWGVPVKPGPGVWEVDGGVVVPPGPPGPPRPHGPPGPPGPPRPPGKPRRGSIPINIEGKTYYLGKLRMDEHVFAALASDERTININPAYSALPTRSGAQSEHIILGVLRAVAEAENRFYADAREASKLVAELRAKLKTAAKNPKP